MPVPTRNDWDENEGKDEKVSRENDNRFRAPVQEKGLTPNPISIFR